MDSEITINLRNNTNDAQVEVNISQTDESKAAEQQTSLRLQQTASNKPRVPCVADTGNYKFYIICILTNVNYTDSFYRSTLL